MSRAVRIVYPLLWSRPGRQACREQTIKTVAALARRGHALTLLMPQGPGDPDLTAAELRDWHGVSGEFRLVQGRSRWAGTSLMHSLMWLRQVRSDPELADADLLYSRIPAMFALGQLAPLPFATDHYRPWPDDLPAIRPLVRRTSRHPRCLGLILHSEHAADAYRRVGIDEARILVAHNGADLAIEPPPTKEAARSALGLPADRPIALYAGRINAEKGLDQILALADLRRDVLFVLVGSEGEGPIERQAAQRPNVRIVPWALPAALPDWLHAADVLLIPASRAPLMRHRSCVLPLKLFGYLAAGRPILAPDSPDTAELLKHEETALLVEPDRPAAAAAALDRLLRDRGLAERLGAQARALAGGLGWDDRAGKISAFLQARLLVAGESRRAAQRSLYSSTVNPISAASTGAAQAPAQAGNWPTSAATVSAPSATK
jgi:glycosyltransferase involved in cell wall biosynthesis